MAIPVIYDAYSKLNDVPEMNDLVDRATAIEQKHSGKGYIGQPVIDAMGEAIDLQKKINSHALSQEQRLEATKQYFELHKGLDEFLSNVEVNTGMQNPTMHRLKVGVGAIASAIPKGIAGMTDLAGMAIERATGQPQDTNNVERINARLPANIDTTDKVLDTSGSLIGGAASTSLPAFFHKLFAGATGLAAGEAAGGMTDDPLYRGAASILGSMFGGTVPAIWKAGRRTAAGNATAGLTDENMQQIREGVAAGERQGLEGDSRITPAQVGESGGFRNLQGAEDRVSARPNSRVAEQQGRQHQNLRAGVGGDAPGEVLSTEQLASAGRSLAADIKTGVKQQSRAAYQQGLESGQVSPQNTAELAFALNELGNSPRGQADPDLQASAFQARDRMQVRNAEGNYEYLTDPNLLKTIEQGATSDYIQGGRGAELKKQANSNRRNDRTIGNLFQQHIEPIARADSAMRAIESQHQNLLNKENQGAWLTKSGDNGTTTAPTGVYNRIFERPLNPRTSDEFNPILRHAIQTRGQPNAVSFYQSALKTNVAKLFADIKTGPDADVNIASQLKAKLNDPAAQMTRQSIARGLEIVSGGDARTGQEVARGLENLLRVTQMMERKAVPGGRPAKLPEGNLETKTIEGVASTTSPGRFAYWSSKLLRGEASESTLHWLDQHLTTPEGVQILREFGKQNWKTDAAQGLYMGTIVAGQRSSDPINKQ